MLIMTLCPRAHVQLINFIKIPRYFRFRSFVRWMMEERDIMNQPEFKQRLFAAHDLLLDSMARPSNAGPLPSSPNLAKLPEFRESLDVNGQLRRGSMGIDCDVVYPNIIIGNIGGARNPVYLKAIGVTHVLNAAHDDAVNCVNTSAEYYQPFGLQFKGFKMDDHPGEDISRYFDEACDCIEQCLASGGRIFVHCWAGLSRSATLVLAFLMVKRDLSLPEAINTVIHGCDVQGDIGGRQIFPNEGFLRKLVILDLKLHPPPSK